MKHTLGAIAVTAALTFCSGLPSTAAFAQAAQAAKTTNTLETDQVAAGATDMSARRYHRRYRVVRPFPVYPYGYPYGYYRPRPVVYPYAYSYYRPRPVYYRPYPYYAPAPFVSVGFGPRYYW
jgi:hypothetical protein